MGLQLKIGADFGDAIKEAKVLEGSIDSLQSKLSGLNKSINLSVNAKLDSGNIRQQIQALKDSVSDITANVDVNSTELQSAFKSIQSKLATLDDLSLDITANKSQVESVISEITSELSSLKATIPITAETNFDSVVGDIRKEIASLTATATVGIDAKDFEARIKAISDKVASLTDARIQVTADSTQAEAQIKEVVSDLNNLRNANVILRADGTQALGVIDTIEGKLNSLRLSIDPTQFKSQLSVIQSELNSLIADVHINGDATQVNAVINELQSKLSALTDPSFDILANPEQAKAAVSELLTSVSKLKDDEILLRADNSQALQSVSTLEKSLQGIQASITVDSSTVQAKAAEIKEAFSKLNFVANVGINDAAVNDTVKRINEKLSLLSDPTIDFKANPAQAEVAINEINSLLKGLKDSNVSLTVSGAEAVEGFISDISSDLLKLKEGSVIPLAVNDGDVKQKIDNVISKVDALTGKKISVGVDTTDASVKLASLEKELRALEAIIIDPNISSTQLELFRANIERIKKEIATIKGTSVSVDVDTTEAQSKVGQLSETIETLRAKAESRKFFITTETDITKIAAYNKEIEELEIEIKRLQNVGKKGFSLFVVPGQTIQSVKNLSGSVAAFGGGVRTFIPPAISNFKKLPSSISPAIGQLKALEAQAKASGAALSSSFSKAFGGIKSLAAIIPGLGLGGLIGLAATAVNKLTDGFFEAAFGASKLDKAIDDAAGSIDKNAASVIVMVKALQSGTLSSSEFKKVKAELISQAPEFQKSFDGDKISIEASDLALQKYIKQLTNTIRVTAALGVVNDALAESLKTIAKGGEQNFGQKIKSFFLDAFAPVAGATETAKDEINSLNGALNAFKPENITKLLEDTFKKLGISFTDFVDTVDDKALKAQLDKIKAAFEKFQNETIAKAKQFKKEFGDAFVLPELEESFFVNKDEIFKRAQKVLSDVKFGDLKIKLPVQVITEVDFLQTETGGLAKEQVDKLQEAFFEELKKAGQEPFVFDPTIQLAINKEKAKVDAEKQAEQLAESIKGIFATAFQSLGADIGNAFTGGKDLFASVFQIIGSGVAALGNQIIALGVAALSLKKALATLLANPALAIAAGVALTAIGTAMKNVASGGVKGFAEGGLVFGPTLGLVGEGFGTNRSNPEVIAPLDQLKSFLGGQGGQQVVLVNSRLRGRDMVLQTNRENRSQRR